MVRAVIGAALLFGAGGAAAQGPTQDVQCLFASNVFAQTEKEPAKRDIARMANFFYMGRVDARLSGAELKAAVAAQSKAITAESVGPIMTNCVKSMQGKLAAMQVIGQELKGTAPK
jgi:hypothetical protein